MWDNLGHFIQQATGYKAFIPLPFPPNEDLDIPPRLQVKIEQARSLIGKLDGISQLLPDKDFFLLMFVKKEATASNQIEGTQADIIDVIEAEIIPTKAHETDAADVLFYIRALNYGLERLKTLPISVRLIKEIHRKLMDHARSTQHSYPGEFRQSQNWIGGTSPTNAKFVPPPPYEMIEAMSDLEKFIHSSADTISPLVKAALLHAQFETIHPFTDGNGRTGRLLITLFLWKEKLLETPLLYLSEFFKLHEDFYKERLQAYHAQPPDIYSWIEFFMDGVIATAVSAVKLASEINKIREQDMAKIHQLGKTAAASALIVLRNLYGQPIINGSKIQNWTGTTRAGAQKIIHRLIDLKILVDVLPEKKYGRLYAYKNYLDLFMK